jgi:hypothetical protein
MREVAAYDGKQAKVIFEASVEKQELVTGSPGAPDEAMSMTVQGEHRAVSVRVLRSYRGSATGTVRVLTGNGGGDCGFDFETGARYLVYAQEISRGTFFTSICSGTAPLDQAGPALRLLRGEAPTPDDLLSPKDYYVKTENLRFGSACGRITRDDGTPFGEIDVEMAQVRDEPFPPKTASDSNLSKPDGTFCIDIISPGKYVLTAEKLDFDHDLRWMGYYPGVSRRSEAAVIEISAGTKLKDMNFSVRKQPVYTVSFKVVAADGSALPLNDLGIMIESPDRDGIGYHLMQGREEGGIYTAGYVPPGKYRVKTIPWGMLSEAELTRLAKWRMAEQEVEISSETQIILKLERAK